MAVPSGQYRLCVYGAEPYLDPCQWGGALAPNVTSLAAAAIPSSSPLSLQKGVQLIVRVHDPGGLLAKAETVHGAAVAAHLSSAAVPLLPLPMVSDAVGFRDYGTYVPFNVPMTVFVSGQSLALTDRAGAALSPQGIAIQVSPADFQLPPLYPPSLARMFPRPEAKVVHVYAGGPR